MQYCTYCGEPADTYDHLIPVSFQTNERGLSGGSRHRPGLGPTVPCCRECNGILGNRMFPSVQARSGHIAERLGVRYKKLLAAPPWTDDELAEVGATLRAQIIAAAEARALIKRRIAFARGGP